MEKLTQFLYPTDYINSHLALNSMTFHDFVHDHSGFFVTLGIAVTFKKIFQIIHVLGYFVPKSVQQITL